MSDVGGTSGGGHEALLRRLDAGGPKRILALDGGGVRGILSLQFLAQIEDILRARRKDPEFVLADYFDLIGGTSTGAIIAAALALRMPVPEIEKLYTDLATRIFKKPWLRFGAFVPKFGSRGLIDALQGAYGADTTLGSSKLASGLMIMTKRMDTGSPWPLTNHPRDPYYAPRVGTQRIGNANMLLWQVVRASTAAPHFFRPEDLDVGTSLDPQTGQTRVQRGQFVDGGISTANNPAFQLLKVALLDGFGFRWQTGPEQLLLVSVGTGLSNRRHGRAHGLGATAGAFALNALLSVMDDCSDDVEMMMQWLSSSPTARQLDRQVRDLGSDLLSGAPLLSYQRYNVLFEERWIRDSIDEARDQRELDALAAMDQPRNMPVLAELGRMAAGRFVSPQHFDSCFDP